MIGRSVIHGSADDSDDFFIVEGWLPIARISVPARQSRAVGNYSAPRRENSLPWY